MSTATLPPKEIGRLRVGEKVTLKLWSGDIRSLEIKAIEPDALVGENISVPVKDIGLVYVSRMNGPKTAGNVLIGSGIAVGAGVVGAAVVFGGGAVEIIESNVNGR